MKRLTAFLICAVALFCFTVPAFAETAEEDFLIPYVYEENISGDLAFIHDLGNCLEEGEAKTLADELVAAVLTADLSVGVMITKDEAFISSKTFAETYYENVCGEYTDAVMLLVDGDTYEHGMYYCGKGEFLFDQDRLDQLNEGVDTYLSDKDLCGAGKSFCGFIRFFAAAGYIYPDKETEEKFAEDSAPAETSDNSTQESGLISASDGRYKMQIGSHYALLHDLDDSLTPDEEEKLFDKIGLTVQSAGFSVCVLISDDIGPDKSDRKTIDYADVYYERECGINTDGILLLINDDTKYDWISTSGKCEKIFYDAKIDALFDKFYDYVKSGDYCEAGIRFCTAVETAAKGGSIGSGTAHGETSYYQEFYLDPGVLFFFVIFIVVGEACLIVGVTNSYKLKPVKGAKEYMLKNTLHFTTLSDVFVRTYVTRHSASSSHHGGGGGHHSSGHHSSGGGHHGGGGRHR